MVSLFFLLVLENGSALLDEGIHTLLLIVGGEGELEGTLLVGEALGEGELEGAVDGILGQGGGHAGVARDGLGGSEGSHDELVVLHDAGNEASALSLLGGVVLAGQAPLHSLGLSNEGGEALGSSDSGDDAKLDLGLSEDGLIGSDDEVAHHGQLASSSEAETIDGGDDGLTDIADTLEVGEHVVLVPVDAVEGGHSLNVSTSNESTSLTGDDHAADVVILVKAVELLDELLADGGVKGVEGLGAVHGEDGDGTLDGDLDEGLSSNAELNTGETEHVKWL